MLEYSHRFPDNPADGDPLIVLLHGRGSDKHDLLGLAPHFPANALIVTPRAPFPGAPWGYGGGFAWYHFLGGTTPEPESFVRGQDYLADFMLNLPGLLPVKPGKIVMGGFSQGSATGLAYALRNPGAVDGVIVLSGLLPSHPSVAAALASGMSLPVFWGHGTYDSVIPLSAAEQGRSALIAAGAVVIARDYPLDHAIDQQELADLLAWLDDLLIE